MSGITVFEQSKSKHNNALSENAITKEQISVKWGREEDDQTNNSQFIMINYVAYQLRNR